MSIATNVKAGAEMLDAKRPGWWREINVTELKVSDGCSCILGQLGGGEVFAWETLSMELIPGECTASYGLACFPQEDEQFAWAWANEINARFELSNVEVHDEDLVTA